ncbi:hypothetical protein EYR36_002644 [Pleurotus pulmonarius]|nr:hypothetical protein EYR36_002644 [Pleurotus pulmonarius]
MASNVHHHPARIPAIPDLRFENSYLRSIRPFFYVRRIYVAPDAKEPDYDHADVALAASHKAAISEEIIIDWAKVLWITTRDQVISPFLQGAVWGIAGHFLVPLMRRARVHSARYIKSRLTSTEGQGITWLRNWVKGFSSTAPGRRKLA